MLLQRLSGNCNCDGNMKNKNWYWVKESTISPEPWWHSGDLRRQHPVSSTIYQLVASGLVTCLSCKSLVETSYLIKRKPWRHSFCKLLIMLKWCTTASFKYASIAVHNYRSPVKGKGEKSYPDLKFIPWTLFFRWICLIWEICRNR
jgi:hypothetical protein